MSDTSERPPFDEARFIQDMAKACEEMDAPFSESVVLDVMRAYGEQACNDGAIQLIAGCKRGRPILSRVLFATYLDTLEIALKHGWLVEDDPMVPLHRSVMQQYPDAIEQPEFTLDKGYDALMCYLNVLHPLEEIMSVPAIPDAIRANKQQFLDLGLNDVLIVHLGYRQKTLSFFFLAKGPLTKEMLDKYAAVAGSPAPSDDVYTDIVGVLLDLSYYLTAVMDFETGKVIRIEFHLFFPVKLPDDMKIPDIGERLSLFFDVPSYDAEDVDILTYVFGECPEGGNLALRSHCGQVRSLMKSWGIVGV